MDLEALLHLRDVFRSLCTQTLRKVRLTPGTDCLPFLRRFFPRLGETPYPQQEKRYLAVRFFCIFARGRAACGGTYRERAASYPRHKRAISRLISFPSQRSHLLTAAP